MTRLTPTPSPQNAAVKVEKFDVDLTLDDDEEAAAGGEDLETALGHVAHYEGYDPGSDQSLSADGQLFGAVASAGDGAMAGNGEDRVCWGWRHGGKR